TMFGQLAYYAKGLEKLIPSIKPIHVKMETAENGAIIDEEIQLFLIANRHSVGGFDALVPMADLQDGLLDCIVMKKTNLAEFVRIVTLAIRGEHMDDPNLVHFRTSSIKITSSEHVQINLDGELGGTLPCTFSVLPQHLNIFMPEPN
ncbi:MAG: diacylglycerol kinase, partial [Bacilli bacterium]